MLKQKSLIFQKPDVEWKDIPGYPNYIVSNDGRVYNKERDRFLSPDNRGDVVLYNATEGPKSWAIHVLMGCVFLGNDIDSSAPEYCKVHHNMIYQKISKALNKIMPKSGKFTLKFEMKDNVYHFYYEDEQNVSTVEFIEENIVNNNNNDNDNDKKKAKYDDEIEQYYINSRKDCVEYGLKSPNEEIIVCTKYL